MKSIMFIGMLLCAVIVSLGICGNSVSDARTIVNKMAANNLSRGVAASVERSSFETASTSDVAKLTVTPETARKSFIMSNATVIAMDGDGKPVVGATIEASLGGHVRRSTVKPSSAVTDDNGAAVFQFRFGYIDRDVFINFEANGAVDRISLEEGFGFPDIDFPDIGFPDRDDGDDESEDDESEDEESSDDESEDEESSDDESEDDESGDDESEDEESSDDDDIPDDIFSRELSVFGIPLKATANVSDAKLLHAANVMAEYLDSDEDGVPNNQEVVDEMVESGAVLILFEDEDELENTLEDFDFPENGGDLLAEEVHPEGSQPDAFDATLEEVLHLITHVGFANVYPDVFGEEGGTEIANAMDTARGGHFEEIPENYPEGAWYTYDDESCDYGCQVTEYTYWALTSILGAQDDPWRLGEIEDEWQLNTTEKVKEKDSAVYNLLSDSQYGMPSALPDGDYKGETFVIEGL